MPAVLTPLRFCLLSTFYPPYNFGGDGIDVQRTARALVRRGHEVTVVHDVNAYLSLARMPAPSLPASTRDGVEVIALRSRLGTLSPLLTHQLGRPAVHGRKLRALMRDRKFDVLVFNNPSLLGGPGLLDLGGEALKVYIAHEHWLVCASHVLWRNNAEPCDARHCARCVLSYRRPPQAWRYTGALERKVSQVHLFIARSEFSRRKHREFGFAPPMRILPYFVPDAVPSAPSPVRSRRPHDRPYFLVVGRLARIKGLHTVIPVFARYPQADLLIAGDGDERAALEAQAAGVPNIRFLGAVPNDALSAYFEHAIALIVPTVGYETFGIVIIESFRHRTPVIARRIGPFPEIVEQSGGGVLFSDDGELLAALDGLQCDAALRESLAARAFAACRQYWSEDVVIESFLGMVEEARGSCARH